MNRISSSESPVWSSLQKFPKYHI